MNEIREAIIAFEFECVKLSNDRFLMVQYSTNPTKPKVWRDGMHYCFNREKISERVMYSKLSIKGKKHGP